jgi:predicted phage baseplate assembly protein
MIPPAGTEIRARSYRYVDGGARGNVGPMMVKVPRTLPPGVTGVANPGKAIGGADEEVLEDTLRRAPELLRTSNHAITAEDYERLVRDNLPGVATVRCLPPRVFTEYDGIPEDDPRINQAWTFGGLNRSIGTINVIIVPSLEPGDTLRQNPRPLPSEDLLLDVIEYLEPRRSLSSKLCVNGPRYLPIKVTAHIRVWQRAIDMRLVASEEEVRTNVLAKIERFLHPLLGGLQGQGWEVGEDVLISDLLETIKLDSRIGFIEKLEAQAAIPAYQPSDRPFASDTPGTWVQLADYELVCSVKSDMHDVKTTVS